MNTKITFFYKKTRRNLLVFSSQVSDDPKEIQSESRSKLFVSRFPRHFKTQKRLFQSNFIWNADPVYSNSSFDFHVLENK